VITPSLESIRAAYEVRTALEVQTTRQAAERRTEEEYHEIETFGRMSLDVIKQGDQEAFRTFDRRFHLAIAGAAGNRRLADLLADYLDLTSTLRYHDTPRLEHSVECALQHMEIADAIRDRSANRAEHRLREHIAKVQALVEEGFNGRAESEPDRTAPATRV
jgi:DNA-binding GntR family transcriptional regulator